MEPSTGLSGRDCMGMERVLERTSTPGTVDTGGSVDDVDGGDDLSEILNGLYREQMQRDDVEVLNVVRQLGGSTDQYLRERKKAVEIRRRSETSVK